MNDPRKVGDEQFFLYDGRAMFDMDRALVLVICDSDEEARDFAEGYGEAVCYRYIWDGEYATEETFQWYYNYHNDPQFSIGER